MILYVFNIKSGNMEEQMVEGTNLFRTLSYFHPKFDKDELLSPRNVSKDGSLHEGTKIRAYLLKQEEVLFVDVWEEAKDKKALFVPDIISGDSFGRYSSNKSLRLYGGKFIENTIGWLSAYSKKGSNFEIKYVDYIKNDYEFSFLNKVVDNDSKKYGTTLSLF